MIAAVASRLTVTLALDEPPPEVAKQVYVLPVVSTFTSVVPQPDVEVIAESGSPTVQETVASETYHPLLPAVPLMLEVMTGGVESAKTLVATKSVSRRLPETRRRKSMQAWPPMTNQSENRR